MILILVFAFRGSGFDNQSLAPPPPPPPPPAGCRSGDPNDPDDPNQRNIPELGGKPFVSAPRVGVTGHTIVVVMHVQTVQHALIPDHLGLKF